MIRAILRNAGIRPGRILSSIRGWRRYSADRKRFRQLMTAGDFAWGRELPILTESDESSGRLSAYFLQDLTVASWIHQAAPVRHVDVGSRIDGFIGNVASFRQLEVIDIRRAPGVIPGVLFHQFDMMKELPDEWNSSTDSLSCLHTIEHFGLGRYGDPLDPDGHLRGLAQLKRMVAPGGLLYLSTPIGPQRVEFNAHRVFAAQTVIEWFVNGWTIERLAFIDDSNQLTPHVDPKSEAIMANFGCTLGIVIIAARKHSPPQSLNHPVINIR